MRRSQPAAFGAGKVGLLVLGVCTVWLVIQNTLLILAMMWSDPSVTGRIAIAVVKAGALVAARFWGSPAAAVLAAAVLLALLLRARPTPPARSEVRHG